MFALPALDPDTHMLSLTSNEKIITIQSIQQRRSLEVYCLNKSVIVPANLSGYCLEKSITHITIECTVGQRKHTHHPITCDIYLKGSSDSQPSVTFFLGQPCGVFFGLFQSISSPGCCNNRAVCFYWAVSPRLPSFLVEEHDYYAAVVAKYSQLV